MSPIHIGLLAALTASAMYAQTATPCPRGIASDVSCYTGQDDNGAYYLIVKPANWNGTLFLFAHGGPLFAPPSLQTLSAVPAVALIPLADGAAVAASTFRDFGYVIPEAAEDTENLRRIFVDAFGAPKRTIAFANSYGGNIIARLMELFGTADDGSPNYDGAFIGCGAVAGYRRVGCAWLDFRAVYQYYCRNLPLPEEPQYELWHGLDPASGRIDEIYNAAVRTLNERANACTGFQLPAAQRSPQQQKNLADILSVMRIPESEFPTWITAHATVALYDIATRLDGRNAFSNVGAAYQGSSDDDALNRGVARYASDPGAFADFSAAADPTGNVSAPVLTLHGIRDFRVFVENQSVYRQTLETAGTADHLFQTYVNTEGHCVYSTSELQASFRALLNWIDTGTKPTQEDLVAYCGQYQAVNKDECRFDPAYQPKPWESHVYPRVP